MITCSTLEKIRRDLENLVNNASSLESEYNLGEHQIKFSMKLLDKDEYQLQVDGPMGLQEANQDNLEKVTNVATLFLSRQLIHILKTQELSPCQNDFHDGDEILEVYKALKAFSAKAELPFKYRVGVGENKRELFSINVSNGHFKIHLETHRIHDKVMKYVTEVEEYDNLSQKAEQLAAFEMIAWLTPKGLRRKKSSFVFARLSSWMIPALVAGVLACGLMVTAWMNFNGSHDWKGLRKSAESAFAEGKPDEGIKLYHEAIIKAEREGVPDAERLDIQRDLVSNTRSYSSFQNYLRESAKLILIAQILNDNQLVEDTMFRVAQDEFVREHYKEALVELNGLIPIVTKSRGKNFDGLIRAYELLGRSYFELNQLEQAKQALLKSVALSKNFKGIDYKSSEGVAIYHLGMIAERENELNAAATYFKTADEIQKLILSKPKYMTTDKRFFELHPNDDLKRVQEKLKKYSNLKE